MLILAFDTTLSMCSVAILNNDIILAQSSVYAKKNHSEVILPSILDTNIRAEREFKDFDAIAITIGPGSFTGVRASLALAKGFSLALKIPIVGINTLHVIAYGASKRTKLKQDIIVINDAGRGDVYVQNFNFDIKPLSEPIRILEKDIINILESTKNITLTGNSTKVINDLVDKYHNRVLDPLIENNVNVDINDLAMLSSYLIKKNGVKNYMSPPLPLYLRPHYAKRKI